VHGAGSLSADGVLIDLGTLSLQDIGRGFFHSSGDIRGNGTVAIQGGLTLHAEQVYPTTLATLNLLAFDREEKPGAIAILGGGASTLPYSVGGALNVYASRIVQSGVLSAPLGSINLGWDGENGLRSHGR
jgi:hypothetical protein